jgi:hypothetical protein
MKTAFKNEYLREIFADEDLKIGPTDGRRTIASAKEVFTGSIDYNFRRHLDKHSFDSLSTGFRVLELHKNALFSELFLSIGKSLDDLCFTQAQIIQVCTEHCAKLIDNGCSNFFLMKEGDDFFVAYVFVYDGGLRVFRFEYDCVWHGEYLHRVFVPATALED